MGAKPTVKVAFSFQDREGRVALLTCYLPFSASDADVVSFANIMLGLLGAISDANIIAYKYTWQWTADDMLTAALSSNSRRALALFYRNSSAYEAIYIPSADMSLTASGDQYDGVRVDYGNPSVQAIIDAFSAALANAVTPEGDPWPNTFVVGGVRI